jgi:hypothetical protein
MMQPPYHPEYRARQVATLEQDRSWLRRKGRVVRDHVPDLAFLDFVMQALGAWTRRMPVTHMDPIPQRAALSSPIATIGTLKIIESNHTAIRS